MPCWLKPQSFKADQPSNANQNVHSGIPIPSLCTSLRPQHFYLFICQWATDLLTCLAFFFSLRECHCFIFSNSILLSEAPTILFLSWTESKIFLTWHFLESYLVTEAVGPQHVKAQRERKQCPESQGQWCSAASTPLAAQGLISASFQKSPLKKTFWSKNSHERGWNFKFFNGKKK